jgi:hypothetical protein
MHAVSRGAPHRMEIQAFQAECRGFETRLPLQTTHFADRYDTATVTDRFSGLTGGFGRILGPFRAIVAERVCPVST